MGSLCSNKDASSAQLSRQKQTWLRWGGGGGVNRVSEVKLDTGNRRIYGMLQMDIVENPTANTAIIQPDTRRATAELSWSKRPNKP